MPYRKFNSDRRFIDGDKPVKEGETYDVAIEGIGSKGDGIGKIQGFVLIVPGAQKGDNVKVKVTAVRGKVAFAEVVGKGEAKIQSVSSQAGESEEVEELSEEDSGAVQESEDSKDSEDFSDSEDFEDSDDE